MAMPAMGAAHATASAAAIRSDCGALKRACPSPPSTARIHGRSARDSIRCGRRSSPEADAGRRAGPDRRCPNGSGGSIRNKLHQQPLLQQLPKVRVSALA